VLNLALFTHTSLCEQTGCGRVYFSSDEDDDANSDDDSVLDMLYGEHDRIDADGNPIYVEDAEGFQFGDDSDQDEERSEDGSELSGDWLVRDDEGDEATWTEGEDEDFVEVSFCFSFSGLACFGRMVCEERRWEKNTDCCGAWKLI
jgi:hypothetical protein